MMSSSILSPNTFKVAYLSEKVCRLFLCYWTNYQTAKNNPETFQPRTGSSSFASRRGIHGRRRVVKIQGTYMLLTNDHIASQLTRVRRTPYLIVEGICVGES